MATICDRWLWQLSHYDNQVHAFERAPEAATFVEAACTHSVPLDQLARGQEGTQCFACLLIVGDHLAEYHRSDGGF